MKKKLTLWLCLTIPILSSCIKDEPLNREADIIDIKVEGDAFIDRSISEDNRKIELIFSVDADLTSIVPILTLSADATVSPASGAPIDLSYGKEVVYTVTAQDSKYQKQYTVSIAEIKMKFEFEEWERAGGLERYKYPILSDTRWSNANSGIVLALMTGGLKNFERFPTDKTEDCVNGDYAASLLTIEGGKVAGTDYALFAGNLLLGDFSANTKNPLKSFSPLKCVK